ncbi:hypothetical protein ACWDA3_40830 [Nonomuraea rubra]
MNSPISASQEVEADTLRPWQHTRRRELDTELPAVRERRTREQKHLDQALEHTAGWSPREGTNRQE